MIKKNTWVSLRATILEAGSRADGIPEDTAAVPLIMWVCGHLLEDCNLGGEAEVRTVTGRIERGILEEAEPYTNVDYGGFVPELLSIGADARKILFGGESRG
jgi:hypothetical protein